jgi:hypothetical protein
MEISERTINALGKIVTGDCLQNQENDWSKLWKAGQA